MSYGRYSDIILALQGKNDSRVAKTETTISQQHGRSRSAVMRAIFLLRIRHLRSSKH